MNKFDKKNTFRELWSKINLLIHSRILFKLNQNNHMHLLDQFLHVGERKRKDNKKGKLDQGHMTYHFLLSNLSSKLLKRRIITLL